MGAFFISGPKNVRREAFLDAYLRFGFVFGRGQKTVQSKGFFDVFGDFWPFLPQFGAFSALEMHVFRCRFWLIDRRSAPTFPRCVWRSAVGAKSGVSIGGCGTGAMRPSFQYELMRQHRASRGGLRGVPVP